MSPPPEGGLRALVRRPVDALLRADLFELGAAMTLLMIVLSLHEPSWPVKLGLVTLTATALVLRPLMRNPLLWLGLVGVLVLAYTQTWYQQNNHDYLKLYWCLGVGVSLLAAEPLRAVRVNARILIGLCFLFATVWKAVSVDYMSGAFFNYFLLQDTRFELFADHLVGLDPSVLMQERAGRVFYTAFGDPAGVLAVPFAAEARWLGVAMTWWTLLIEGAVALAFLLPARFTLAKWRDAVLLVFIFSTYFIAPILYFAWLITAMGLIQCERETFRYAPVLYVAAFVLVLMRFYLPV
ncbi:MAG: hypothetical protein AAGF99_00225 [Bacteroidota bacterium]